MKTIALEQIDIAASTMGGYGAYANMEGELNKYTAAHII